MKKALNIIVVLFAISINAQSSKKEFKFEDYQPKENSKYESPIEISFGGEYTEAYWELKRGNQFIYFTQQDLDKATIQLEKAFNKAVEWDKVADENNVDEIIKKMDFSFKTSKGMVEDSGYSSVGPRSAKIKFERFIWEGETRSVMTCGIWQCDEYSVRCANFSWPSIYLKNSYEVAEFKKFLDFLKNSKATILEKIEEENKKASVFN